MKNVIFGENEDLTDVALKLFNDDNDPRSINYKRVLVKPSINWLYVSLFMLIPILIIGISYVVFYNNQHEKCAIIAISAIVLIFYYFLTLKKSIICLIRIYQHFAPDTIRNKCRFEPSCSEYMIISINKYGLIKGIKKGIGRLHRCNIQNGGYDYP